MRIKNLKNDWERLTAANSFVLACHQRPDGDALGSALGLAHVLRGLGKDVVVISTDGVPENYAFIPESESVLRGTDRRDFEIGMIVDCESAKRVGDAAEIILSARATACIDHHIPDGEFGDIRVVDSSASSTAEVIVDLLDANDVTIDATAAAQLMTGLIADTGAFKFANTTPRTFSIASRLTALGADPALIAREVYESRSLREVRLLGRALGSVTTDESGTIAWGTITRNDLAELCASDEDTDGIVNYVGMVKGVTVHILFREVEPESIRVSLRSRGRTDVNQIARVFGGGGHKAAAGCTLDVPLDEARKKVLAEVRKWMAS